MNTRIRVLALATAMLALASGRPSAAAAQGWIEPGPRWPGGGGVERLSSDVTITVDALSRVARVEVEERFRNASPRLLEGDYLYPIPPGAVFSDLSLFMGERELKGEVLNGDEARKIYEEIVRRRKDPALVELVGHGVLRARVFPVSPGETRRVILRYTQILSRDADLLRLRYPRIVGIIPGMESNENARPVVPNANRFSLRIRVTHAEHLGTPYSPTHTVQVHQRSGGDELEITHEGTGATPRDFELFLPMRKSAVGASVVPHAVAGEPGYFMLLIAPAAAAEATRIPRDVTLVLDVSGSMSGEKIEQARSALEQMLGGLGADDRFRLITFSSVVRSFRPEFSAASRENVRAAREFLEGVRAEGSTNVMAALEEALKPTVTSGRLSMVLFLTDGKPTVGERSPERIADAAARLRDGERVFAFGVGYDVNTYLLDRVTEGGRGAVSYVRPGDDVEAAVSSLTRKLRFPALADLRIVDAPAQLEDEYPNPLPDLFYGEELVLFGRYRGHGSGDLALRGRRAGRTERFTYRVEFPERESENDFIPRLWAARKAGALAAQIRLHGPDAETVEAIRQLGLRYGILTDYTSYLVQEPELALRRMTEDEMVRRARDMSAAPSAQTGAVAFEQADRASRLREAKTMAEATAAPVVLKSEITGRAGGPMTTRQAARRLFVLRDGVWTDLRYDASLPVVRVSAYSPAYFELISRLPGLKPYLAVGERVRIAGEGLTLEIAPDGLESWPTDRLNDVVRAFRRDG